MEPRTVGALLRAYREDRGLTLRDVERRSRSAISNSYLSQLEQSRRGIPTVKVLARLAAVYEIPVSEVLLAVSQHARRQPVAVTPRTPNEGALVRLYRQLPDAEKRAAVRALAVTVTRARRIHTAFETAKRRPRGRRPTQ